VCGVGVGIWGESGLFGVGVVFGVEMGVWGGSADLGWEHGGEKGSTKSPLQGLHLRQQDGAVITEKSHAFSTIF
jgi:hypothetical protein